MSSAEIESSFVASFSTSNVRQSISAPGVAMCLKNASMNERETVGCPVRINHGSQPLRGPPGVAENASLPTGKPGKTLRSPTLTPP